MNYSCANNVKYLILLKVKIDSFSKYFIQQRYVDISKLPWNPKLILFSELIKGLKTLVSGLSVPNF